MNAHASPPCSVTCQLTATTSIPSGDGIVWVLVDNNYYTQLPNNFSFLKGTTHTIQVLNQTLTAPSGSRYVWKQWSLNGAGNLYTNSTSLNIPSIVVNYTVGQGGAFTAVFQQQFLLNLQFSDPKGQPVPPPSSVTLHSGTSTIVETSYQGLWLDATLWIVNNATWEGDPNTESGTASFDLSAGPVMGTLVLRAYTATVEVVDISNNPLANASITATLANNTIRTFNTDIQGRVHLGHIPLGPYSIQINYQGRDMGNWTSDASTSPTLTAKLDVAGPQQPPTLTDPLSLVKDHWQLAAVGFFAGFLCMGITVRLTGRRTRLPGAVAQAE
jgi:hypothetical protein